MRDQTREKKRSRRDIWTGRELVRLVEERSKGNITLEQLNEAAEILTELAERGRGHRKRPQNTGKTQTSAGPVQPMLLPSRGVDD